MMFQNWIWNFACISIIYQPYRNNFLAQFWPLLAKQKPSETEGKSTIQSCFTSETCLVSFPSRNSSTVVKRKCCFLVTLVFSHKIAFPYLHVAQLVITVSSSRGLSRQILIPLHCRHLKKHILRSWRGIQLAVAQFHRVCAFHRVAVFKRVSLWQPFSVFFYKLFKQHLELV